METERREIQGKRGIFRVTKFSRRQVLKSAGIMAAGAAISSISLASGCKPSSSNSTGKDTGVNPTTSSSLPTSSFTAPTSVAPTSTIPVASTTATTGYSYVPPTTFPPLITVTGTQCTVATDRLYSKEHLWVKALSSTTVVMGITHTMVKILDNPYRLSLSQVGTMLANGDAFGTIEGWKMTADLLTPVSGTLIGRNILAIGFVGEDGVISALQDHYRGAWMIVVQLSKPAELNSLLTAQQYAALVEGVESGADTRKP